MGNISVNISIKVLWRAWKAFRAGKRRTPELERFTYNLEDELFSIQRDLANGTYAHGDYKTFEVSDNKRRVISVAGIRDRVVHRLLYDFLVKIYDKTFIFDAWSCRKGKGLIGAIERAQSLLNRNWNGYVWRCDIKKFFDSVDKEVLFKLVSRRINDQGILSLIKNVVISFRPEISGMPIGNLTSQIFANIYLNELDRFVSYDMRPNGYLRYGDDFIVIDYDKNKLSHIRAMVTKFINEELFLSVNKKSDLVIPVCEGIKYLGCWIYPNGRCLNMRNISRIQQMISINNISSYSGIIKRVDKSLRRSFEWDCFKVITEV